MATITASAAGGAWNTNGAWTGGVQPGTGDTAVFTAASGNVNIPASTTVTVGAVDFSGLGVSNYTGTFTFSATTSVLSVGSSTLGNVTFVAGMTLALTGVGTINLLGSTASTTYNFTSAGLTMPNITVAAGTTTTYQFQDNVTGATLTLTQGIWNWNSKTIIAASFVSAVANTRQLLMGAASVTITSGTNNAWLTNLAGFTLSAGTSTITFTGAAVAGAAVMNSSATTASTYNNVVFSGSGVPGILIQTSTTTIANLTRTGTAVKTDGFQIHPSAVSLIVSGTLTLTGNSLTNRLLVTSDIVGTQRTVALGATGTSSTNANVDFMDIAITGTSAPLTGTSLGDCQGNSGITFTSAVTRYGVVAGNGSSTATWSTSSGGTGGASVPLPQDTMILDANSGAGTYTMDMPRLGVSLTCTGFTRTLALNSTPNTLFGSLTLASGMTFTATQNITLAGRSNSTITNAGNVFGVAVSLVQVAQYSLNDALTCTVLTLSLATGISTGTFTTNNFSVTATNIVVNGMTSTWGTSTVTLTASSTSTPWSAQTTANATVSAESASFVYSSASTNTRSFNGSGRTYGALTYTVANSRGPLVISNNGGTIGTLSIGPGRVWTNTAGTTCTFGAVNASGVSNGYQYFPGVAGNYASTPAAAPVQLNSNFTIDAMVALNSWAITGQNQIFVAQGYTAASSLAYQFFVSPSGVLVMQVSANGTSVLATFTSTVTTGLSANTKKAMRASVTLTNGSNSTCNFYTSPDGNTWTQLGSTVTQPIITSIFTSSAAVEFATNVSGTSNFMVGSYYEAKIYNSALGNGSGTPIFDANFATKSPCATAFTESSSNAATVTINGAMAQAGDGSIVLNSSTPGTQATMTSPGSVKYCPYMIIQDSKVQGGASWFAGSHSNNVSNNTNWNFIEPASTQGFFKMCL